MKEWNENLFCHIQYDHSLSTIVLGMSLDVYSHKLGIV